MNLEEFEKDGVSMVRAIDDVALFVHCTNGRKEVPIEEFRSSIKHLIFLHGRMKLAITAPHGEWEARG